MKTLILAFLFTSFSASALACTMTSTVIDSEVSYKSYVPKSEIASDQVVLLPPTGGENIADRKLAKYLCNRGVNVEIVNFPQDPGYTHDLGIHDELNHKSLQAIHRFLERKPKSFVVLGSSLGGIYATLIYTLGHKNDPQYPLFSLSKGLITVVAGGPISKVVSTSTLASLTAQRKLCFEYHGFKNAQEYEEALSQAIKLDPYKEALALPNTYMYVTQNDTVVPTETQFMLAEKMNATTIKLFAKSHARAVAYVYLRRADEILGQLKKILKP